MRQGAKLLPYRNVLQNAAISLELRATLTPETIQKLTELLDFLGLAEFPEYYRINYFNSGDKNDGIQKRVFKKTTYLEDRRTFITR